jgi:hypothetical protein
MSTVEPLNSEPEVISGVEENIESDQENNVDENTCTCHCHEKTTVDEVSDSDDEDSVQEIENSAIFLVSIDSVPHFYCQTYEEAVDQATDFLRNMLPKDFSTCKYNIEQEGNEITLSSIYKFLIVQYETVEAVANIRKISRIQFVEKSEKKTE